MDTMWDDDDVYWRENYSTRPYTAGRDYEMLRPAYRYGYESANRYSGQQWTDVESDLERDWSDYPNRGTGTWQQMKAAVRDAWDRVTGNR